MIELIFEPSILASIAFILLFSLFLVSDCGSFILDNVKGQLKSVVPEENIILITGCDTGFGAMASIELTKSGYNVVSACLTEDGKKSLEGKVALSILCDVTNEKDVLRLALATEDLAAKNKLRLWAVINNAGIAPLGNMDWLSMGDIKRVMDINYIGTVSVIKATLPELKKTRNSRIINISSIAGLGNGMPFFGAYSASKHAIEGMSKCLRVELKPWGVHVCNINPGVMATPLIFNTGSLTRKLLEAAPVVIKNQYPDVLKSIEKFESLTKFEALFIQDPKVVVMAIKRLIITSNPSLVNLTGFMAKFIGFSLLFPAYIVDWVGSFFSVVVKPSPEVLAKMQKSRRV
mmetsp:Transcript_176/g.218  ORF Transcript_176/g.218 Transcript_176/m.218 type:complete len:347 (+) Transcript_176:38-1078(+)